MKNYRYCPTDDVAAGNPDPDLSTGGTIFGLPQTAIRLTFTTAQLLALNGGSTQHVEVRVPKTLMPFYITSAVRLTRLNHSAGTVTLGAGLSGSPGAGYISSILASAAVAGGTGKNTAHGGLVAASYGASDLISSGDLTGFVTGYEFNNAAPPPETVDLDNPYIKAVLVADGATAGIADSGIGIGVTVYVIGYSLPAAHFTVP